MITEKLSEAYIPPKLLTISKIKAESCRNLADRWYRFSFPDNRFARIPTSPPPPETLIVISKFQTTMDLGSEVTCLLPILPQEKSHKRHV